ncbi:hypothetical protein CO641_11605 [Lysobacteraceae bacterium NML91-0213]|nr:hypothetical protein CO641_11605 [Xanthomonadaceae bacterium NML91-0213]
MLVLATGAAHGQQVERMDPYDAVLAEQAAGAHRAYANRFARALAASGEPRSLAYAALLRDADRALHDDAGADADLQSRKWRALAFQRAGADIATLAFLAAAAPVDDPTAQQALARWHRLQPDNAAPWMYANEVDATQLQAMTSLRRADFLLNERLRWLIERHRADPPTPAEGAALYPGRDGMPASLEGYVVAYAVGLLVPNPMSLQSGSVWHRCRAGSADRNMEAIRGCRVLANALLGADNRLMEIVGAGLARELAPDASSQRAAEEASRRIDWQTSALGRIPATPQHDSEAATVQAILDPAVSSERQVVEQQLRAAGIPLDPPTGWRPQYR